ncbi:LysE family translocator [Methylobacterium sp. HMF5984]|jgi:threonine/homoserine/homoserine lactone efflux protein|uniref:LysE family translocator n=2 Tax=Methylobacterium TaxID=407 RepID=UPI0011CCC925|nr:MULTISPECIES: LysE family translocator [unclassified Methylobacterium]MCJ2010464.1 LysE family translocator [Methylobacterium sp. J-092]MCJ2038611.1 LysE family translocator [Methylobacterium sp. J-059]MCJ2077954.1 LysE family translocator [Methylobacterium sp. E-016]TXN58548.1 LysE family translocator [Methylobacterium sp. WL6]
MNPQTWALFLCAVFLLSGTPGPNMLHVMTRSLRFGLGASLFAMAGCLSAVVLVLCASATGLGAVLAASPNLFAGLRYAGVAYLVLLGIQAWRGAGGVPQVGTGPIAPSAGGLFRGGFLIGASNPKLLLFAAAFLPQFIDPAADQGLQLTILVATFAAAEAFWYAVYALGGRQLARHLARPALRRLFDRATGAIFVGFGLGLLAGRP